MATKEKVKMPQRQRAKQFAPFAALVGFDIALEIVRERNQEKIEGVIQRISEPEKRDEISEEDARNLRQIDPLIEKDPVYWIA